jgi:WD40 repeat protein
VNEEGVIHLINPLTDEPIATFTIKLTDAIALTLAWSADDSKLAVGDSKGQIHILDINTGETTSTKGHDTSIEALDWSPEHLLASAGYDGIVRIWDTNVIPPVLFQTIDNIQPVFDAAWSPNGEQLAYGGLTDTAQQVFEKLQTVFTSGELSLATAASAHP